MKMTLDAETARLFAYDAEGPIQGLTRDSNDQINTTRWTSVYRLVLRDGEGKYWMATYEVGLTDFVLGAENQDIEPFEYKETIEFVQVDKIEVKSYDYVSVP